MLRSLWIVGLCLLIAVAQASQLPTFPQVQQNWQSSYARLLDRHGHVLAYQRLNKQQHRFDWTPLEEVSPALIDALLFVEDRDFYQHHGVDWGAVSRSAVSYLTGQKARGASTLTMQLTAMLDPTLSWQTGGRSVKRKWQQLQAARQLEKTWTKAQILEGYINLMVWRGDLQGISTASLALFGKWPRGLNKQESILLVSLLAAPNASIKRIAERACLLIKAGYQADCAEVQQLAVEQLSQRRLPIEQRADSLSLAARLLTQAQQDYQTTVDKNLQDFSYHTLRSQLASLAAQKANAGAVLVLNNQTGEVLAYVANSGLVDDSVWVDGIYAPRQAGSTLKPFLYGLAFDKQLLTAASVLDDQTLNISTELGLYVPQNYEKDFKGAVTVRRALASSLNIPAVLTLNKVGIENFWKLLKDLDFSLEQQADYYGNALALGGADINLWQLANAYRALANQGQFSESSLELSPPTSTTKTILSPQASFIIADILSDRNARSLSFDYENALATPYWSAVKTGTSKDMRDNWCVGFSRRFTVAVWVGNMQGLPMRDVSGITGAAPVWQMVMNYLEAGAGQSLPPMPPDNVTQQSVEFEGFAQPNYQEWFIHGTEQSKVSYWPNNVAQIVYPVSNTIIALDPDMPKNYQKVFFKAKTGGEQLSFWLNEQQLASAQQDYPWQPKRGRYVLQLKNAQGQVRAEVRFEVRGRETNH